MQAGLEQWVPTFLIPRHLSAVPHALVTPATKLVSLLPRHFNFATIMNCNINIGYARDQLCDPKGVMTYKLRTTGLEAGKRPSRTKAGQPFQC